MKGLLDTIRGRTRSPPPNSAQQRRMASRRAEREALDAAMAASLSMADGGSPPAAPPPPPPPPSAASARDGDAGAASAAASASGYPVPPASSGGGRAAAAGAGYPLNGVDDEEAAIAAAIGASLDLQEAGTTRKNGNNTNAPNPRSSGGGGGGGGFTGSNASQDVAFLTDGPLLPPAPAPSPKYKTGRARRDPRGASASGTGGRASKSNTPPQGIWDVPAGGAGGGAAARNRGGGVGGGGGGFLQGGGGWTGGPAFGGLSAAPQAKAPIPNEDEELARRLQEQWVSEDTAGGGGGLGGEDFQWPSTLVTQAPGHPFAPRVRICAACALPITDMVFRNGPMGSFHVGCAPMVEHSLPPCRVCHERLPAQDGRVHFYRHNYFQDVYCPWHHESSPRCCSCMRLEPMAMPGGGGEAPFAELSDGRMLCMACVQTAVVDSSEGAPAFEEVCRFFEKQLNLHVPQEMREVPVLVVDSPTLNEQTHRDPKHGSAVEQGMPTTRGLTLSEVATVMHMSPGAMLFNAALGRFEVGPRSQVNLGEQRAVTAILVLCGLPYASFSAILAHEATHAWMKLDPSFPSHLPPQVEEGVCQLIALLWLQHLAGRDTGDEGGGRGRLNAVGAPPTNEELRGFFMHQIKTDVSAVYGDGFRKAKAVYDAVGLDALLRHVKRYESFPTI